MRARIACASRRLDLIVGNHLAGVTGAQSDLELYWNAGSGNLARIDNWAGASIQNTFALAWGDTNGDGRLELVTSDTFFANSGAAVTSTSDAGVFSAISNGVTCGISCAFGDVRGRDG